MSDAPFRRDRGILFAEKQLMAAGLDPKTYFFIRRAMASAERFGLKINEDGKIEGGRDAVTRAFHERKYLLPAGGTPEARIRRVAQWKEAGLL
jgi:hypothetical protein